MIYALLDLSVRIRLEHLEATLAMWRYSAASAAWILLPDGSFGTPIPVFGAGGTANIASPTMTIAADGTVWVAWDYQKPRRKLARFFSVRTDIASAPYGASFGTPQWATAYTKDFVDQCQVALSCVVQGRNGDQGARALLLSCRGRAVTDGAAAFLSPHRGTLGMVF